MGGGHKTEKIDGVAIPASESKVPLEEEIAMRFILRQPSPEWKAFSLEDIIVYRETLCANTSQLHQTPSKLEILRKQTMDALRGQLVEDGTGSVLLPAKYDVANIHF